MSQMSREISPRVHVYKYHYILNAYLALALRVVLGLNRPISVLCVGLECYIKHQLGCTIRYGEFELS
jgi:hypothetical protein